MLEGPMCSASALLLEARRQIGGASDFTRKEHCCDCNLLIIYMIYVSQRNSLGLTWVEFTCRLE